LISVKKCRDPRAAGSTRYRKIRYEAEIKEKDMPFDEQDNFIKAETD
jgi:hypothetical protein